MKSLEILILSGCSNLKRIPEFGENMESVLELYLDGIAITKLPTSIGNLIGLASLNVRDCKNLISLPSTFFNMKRLKYLNLSRCSKLENLVTKKSAEEVDVSGTATGLLPFSNALFRTLKKLAFSGFMPRSPNCMGLLSTSLSGLRSLTKLNLSYCNLVGLLSISLSGLCSLTSLDLSYCNLNAIPNDICCLFSLKYLYLSGNNFSCLPESIAQLSRLYWLLVDNCTSLRSWPKLPLNVVYFSRYGCILLEAVPDLFRTNCSKLAENQEFVDIYFAMIINSLWHPLFLSGIHDIVFPGSEIPKWFRHQSIGDEVSIPYSLLCNECLGIAICVVFCSHSHHRILEDNSLYCCLIVNGKQTNSTPGITNIVPLSDHIWLLYLLPQFYQYEDIKSLWECNANGFRQIGIKILSKCWNLKTNEIIPSMVKVKKCGLRMAYKKDIENLNETLAERSNNSITPYEGLDVPHHNFDNSIAAESYTAKLTHDDYEGAGSSNYEPHPKRIERLIDFMAQGNSNCEESSEYKECAEVLGDWQESNESDLEG